MINSFAHPSGGRENLSAANRIRRSNHVLWAWFILLTAVAGYGGVQMLSSGPDPALIVWFLYLLGAVAILFRPRYGLYLLLALGLAGDSHLMPGFPFVKNFSSRESLLFLHDDLIVNPLETYLFLTLIAWLIHETMQRKLRVYRSAMFWPALLFLGFVVAGLVYGIGTGGSLNIALWEARPIFYLITMLILTSNLLEKPQHVSHLVWAAMVGLLFESLYGTYEFFFVLNGTLAGVEAITEHAAAIHMNSFIILALAVWLEKSSAVKRLLLPLGLPFILLAYLATQRRAAFLSLGIALVLLAIYLYRERRQLFWIIVPPAAVVGLAYVLVFWNASGALGIPAQAVKSIVAPEQANAADVSSNVYRLVENINTSFTIHQEPLTGVGFGQKFHILIPLPDISVFEWWEYLPHNSIIWIWLKAGVGGFIAMLIFVGAAVMTGARAIFAMPSGKDAQGDLEAIADLHAIALTATLYIVMHFIYAYVDISWDTQSMIYVGAMIGIVSCLERIGGLNRPLTADH